MGRATDRMEIAIGFVHDQRDTVLARQIGKGTDQGGGIFHTCGVVRADQRDGAGARRDQRCSVIRIGQHVGTRWQRHGCDAGHVEPHFMIEIPWGWQDNLIPFGGQGHKRRIEGLVAAGGDRHLCRFHRATIEPGRARGHFGAQIVIAQNGPVKMRLRGVDRGVGDGLAHRKRRQLHRGGLTDIDQRTLCRKGDPVQPAPGLHHRRRKGRGGAGQSHGRRPLTPRM